MNSELTEAFRKLRKQRDAEAKDRLANSYQSYDARLRSGWDDYGGAIEKAAREGDAARLTDLLRAHRPLTDLTDEDYERFADLIEQQGKKGRGQPPKHAAREATRMARTILDLKGPEKREAVAGLAAKAVERITGTPVTGEEVQDRLRRGRKGRS